MHTEQEIPFGGHGGNGGSVMDTEELVRETVARACAETGLTGVTVSVKLDHDTPAAEAKKARDPNSPKQAREICEEELQHRDDLYRAARTLRTSAVKDIRTAEHVLNQDGQGSADFLRGVFPEETASVEQAARREGKEEVRAKVMAGVTIVASIALYAGKIAWEIRKYNRSKTLKGRVAKWLTD